MKTTKKDLLDAGCHFGHLTRKWNPKMAPYIFAEKNGIHIIDLNKTHVQLENVCEVLKRMAAAGKRILFVATKKQAREIVSNAATTLNMPFVTERWLGGMLTNFATIRRSLNKMSTMERMIKDNSFANLAKRERLMKAREKEKLSRILGGISKERRLPNILFILDVKKEHIAVKEAKRSGIPIFAIVDTNSDPDNADHFVVANDDAFKSIQLLISTITTAIQEGLDEKKVMQEAKSAEKKAQAKDEDDSKVEKATSIKVKKISTTEKSSNKSFGKDGKVLSKVEKATSKEEKTLSKIKKTVKKEGKASLKVDKVTSKEDEGSHKMEKTNSAKAKKVSTTVTDKPTDKLNKIDSKDQ